MVVSCSRKVRGRFLERFVPNLFEGFLLRVGNSGRHGDFVRFLRSPFELVCL